MARSISVVFTFFLLLLLLVVTVCNCIYMLEQRKTCYVNVFSQPSCFSVRAEAECIRGCDERGYDGGRCQYKTVHDMEMVCFCKIKGCVSD
ncbi:unnamed protein product [Lupinus luteus]|uniref:Uncharacterized protein n=1 Tax=Lupinus luteus TaxID=3873 RepID=A0AAV1WUN2_LUPLU